MSKTGLNVGQELLSGIAYPTWSLEDIRMFIFHKVKHFRIAISDYGNVSAVALTKRYAEEIKKYIPDASILWGLDKRGNKWRSSQWAALKAKHTEAATYAQSKGFSLSLGNEDSAFWCIAPEAVTQSTRKGQSVVCSTYPVLHGLTLFDRVRVSGVGVVPPSTVEIKTVPNASTFTFTTTDTTYPEGTTKGGTVTPEGSVVLTRYAQLASVLRVSGITIPLIHAIGQGHLPIYKYGAGDLTLSFNVYGEGGTSEQRFTNFKAQVDQFLLLPQPPNALKMVTEYGIHADYKQYPADYATQVMELQRRHDYLELMVDRHYFFNWRSNSHSGNMNDNFAMRLTWSPNPDIGMRWSEII